MPDLEIKELSERELEILRLVATGVSNKEIAHRLFISSNTVKVHLRNIFSKIGVVSRTEAALYAVKMGLVEASIPPGGENMVVGIPAEAPGIRGQLESLFQERNFRIGAAAIFSVIVLSLIGLGILLGRQTNGSLANNPSVDTSAEQRWQALQDMPTARFGLAVVAYEDNLYAIAGETDQGATGAVERFSPASDSWETLASKPTAVSDVSAAVSGGKIYVPGGRTTGGAPTDVLDIYDPRQEAWSKGAPLPLPISAYALVSFEGKLYLFGGWDGKRYLDLTLEYDPGQDRWFERATMPTRRAFAGAAVAGGKINVLGGYDGAKALAVNEIYLPELDNGSDDPWETGKPMPEAKYGMGVTSVGEIIHVIGGYTGPTFETTNSNLSFQIEEWDEFERFVPQPGAFMGVATMATKLYILGGKDGEKAMNENLAYQAIYTVLFPIVK